MEMIWKYVVEFWAAFVQLSFEMAPWLLLGFIFAGLFKAWFPDQWAEKYLSKPNFSSVVWASVLGVPLPLCSCGVLPMAVSLNKKGASKGAINSFLISTPQTGVDNIFATYSLLGLPFAISRPVIAFISGIFGGALMNFFTRNEVKEPIVPEIDCATTQSNRKNEKNIFAALKYGFTDLFREMYVWLLVGLALAAFLNLVLPDDLSELFAKYPGSDMFLALLISVPMYICATGSIPVALVLLLKGFSPGAAIVLLMAGPATNIAGIVLLTKSISARFATIYVLSITIASLFFGWMANLLFTNATFVQQFSNVSLHEHCHTEISIYQWVSLLILALLVLNFIVMSIYKKVIPFFKDNEVGVVNNYLFQLEDVSCKNCVKKIESKLILEKGVVKATVDLEKQQLSIETTQSPDKITKIVKDLGYGCEQLKE